MGCTLSKRQLSEASNEDRSNVIHRPSNHSLPSPTAPLTTLLSNPNINVDVNASATVDVNANGPGLRRPDMDSQDSVLPSSAREPEPVPSQPPANSDVKNEHVPDNLECGICGESTVEVAIHPCNECKSPYCVSCLKSLFLTACKDETLMPARCCQIIQLPIVLPYLSQEEANLYRAKFEERSSSHRVYCPVPTCSTFIPSRLIPATIPPTPPQSRNDDLEGSVERQTPNQTVTFGTGIRMEIHTPPETPPSTDCTSVTHPPPTMSCPQCAAQICLSCKQLKHPQRPCSADDLDPELAALLRRWKIKRCPKCRAAVRRMFGCSHICCRCGAQWCWDCLKPIHSCQATSCTEEADADADEERRVGDGSSAGNGDDERTPGGLPVEDLDDEQVRSWARASLDFGDEPTDDTTVDPWNCERHFWRRVIPRTSIFVGGKAECHKCWKEVQAAEPLADGITLEHGELVALHAVNDTADGTTSGVFVLPVPENAAYDCLDCGLIICPACKMVDTANR